MLNNQIIEWKLDQEPECMICGKQEKNIWGGLEVHHIVARSLAPSLKLEPANFLLLCRICHMRCENYHVVDEVSGEPLSTIDMAHQLYFKSCKDPDNHKPRKLKKHYQALPKARRVKCI